MNFYPCSWRMVVKNPWIRHCYFVRYWGYPRMYAWTLLEAMNNSFCQCYLASSAAYYLLTAAIYTWYKCGTVYKCMIVCETTTYFHKKQQQSLDFGVSQIISQRINFTKLKFHQLNWSLRSGFPFSMVHFQNSFALWFVNITEVSKDINIDI